MMEELELPFVESVFHPSEFSESSHLAFVHALAISLIRSTRLDNLPARGPDQRRRLVALSARAREPRAMGRACSRRSAVFDELSVRVRKVNAEGNPVERSLEFIQSREPDLVVMATGARRCLSGWLEPSRALAIARRSRAMTLSYPRAAGASPPPPAI
jgi:nucleotide-binding universal stress UspA family protein